MIAKLEASFFYTSNF